MNRAILHVDMDAFYASVEQRDDPRLAGLPLIVGGRGPRGVVAAASYEVRRYGVRSAMPTRRALELCPQALIVAPRMARYREVSRQVFAIFARYTPEIEGLSLDEAYLDVTASLALHGPAPAIAARIKADIRRECVLTASVGVAPNKLVAKIASDLDKPDGLTIVMPDAMQALLDPLPVTRLPGLGRKKGQEVMAAGIQTLGQLRRADDARLRRLFGNQAPRLRERAGGIDDRPVNNDHREQSISSECTFDHDLHDGARLRAELLQLADQTSQRLRRAAMLAGCVSVKIRRGDFSTFTRQQAVHPPSCDSQVIAGIATALLAQWSRENPRAALRLLGVGTSNLTRSVQIDLFSQQIEHQSAPLDPVLDRIREKFGRDAIFRAGGALRTGRERH
ncbi:MAG: DNA polymerase IV [Steroidobacteraceae bacterium]